jgi:hypothetical protein
MKCNTIPSTFVRTHSVPDSYSFVPFALSSFNFPYPVAVSPHRTAIHRRIQLTSSTLNTAGRFELRRTRRLEVTSLGSLEVDDVPDSGEVL